MSHPERVKSAVICGASEGLGTALCAEFVDAGYQVAAIRQTQTETSTALNIQCDLGDPKAVRVAFESVEEKLGPLSVVVHNAAAFSVAPFLETRLSDFEAAWAASARAGFVVAQEAVPRLRRAGGGSLVFSGATASMRGSARFAALASAKFAQRALAQSLAREFGGKGIHVAHVVLDGVIWCDWTRERFGVERKSCLEAGAVARVYRQLHEQDPSAWTHELDLRPAGEAF